MLPVGGARESTRFALAVPDLRKTNTTAPQILVTAGTRVVDIAPPTAAAVGILRKAVLDTSGGRYRQAGQGSRVKNWIRPPTDDPASTHICGEITVNVPASSTLVAPRNVTDNAAAHCCESEISRQLVPCPYTKPT